MHGMICWRTGANSAVSILCEAGARFNVNSCPELATVADVWGNVPALASPDPEAGGCGAGAGKPAAGLN